MLQTSDDLFEEDEPGIELRRDSGEEDEAGAPSNEWGNEWIPYRVNGMSNVATDHGRVRAYGNGHRAGGGESLKIHSENEPESRRRPVRITTLEEATEHCKELLTRQMQKAQHLGAEMNVAISGDAHARTSVLTLLPDSEIRNVFMWFLQTRGAVERIRSLFGCPPYHFLLPQDNGLIRAKGVVSSRTNMTYSNLNKAASYSQFGSAHLVDMQGRDYRVLSDSNHTIQDRLPFAFDEETRHKPYHMQVRIKKMRLAQKRTLMRDASTRGRVTFPRVGDTLQMRYSRELNLIWIARTEEDAQTLTFRVVAISPRASNSSTASVLLTKV